MNDETEGGELVAKKEEQNQALKIMPPGGDLTPMAMIQIAVQQGADPDKMAQLFDLQERYEANVAKKSYAAAMSKVQAKLPTVLREADNKQTNSKYAKEESISRVIKPIYTKQGFSVSYNIGDSPLPDHIRVLCDISHKDGHIEQKHIDYPYDIAGLKGTVNKTKIHAYKSTISYAKNTLLCMAFNVATGDDDDAQGVVEYITEEDAANIRDFMDEVNIDRPKFFKYMGVTAVGLIKASDLQKARSALEQKAKRNKAKGE